MFVDRPARQVTAPSPAEGQCRRPPRAAIVPDRESTMIHRHSSHIYKLDNGGHSSANEMRAIRTLGRLPAANLVAPGHQVMPGRG